MMAITSYEKLEELGRVRLSRSFFMRDFLHSEIAAWHGFKNVPDHPDETIAVGRMLCEQLLEPLQETFGRIHVRSGYRSPEVNRFGNENKLNCASNEANYAHHIWDYPDSQGKRGATACIVIPWLVDHIEKGGSWTDMAWWIHDHLPYSSLYFFPKLAAFNINWHEAPIRRIDSYAPPKGCLTRPGMANHAGSHADQYEGFPLLRKRGGEVAGARCESKTVVVPPRRASASAATSTGVSAATKTPSRPTPTQKPEPSAVGKPVSIPTAAGPSAPISTTEGVAIKSQTGGSIHYRAIHTKNLWRRVNSHKSLDAAINGKDGAAGLFARKVRINYETHGDPRYVLVWESGASSGYVIKADPSGANGIRIASAPMADLQRFEMREQASQRELELYFTK
jgi:hypothetical protein